MAVAKSQSYTVDNRYTQAQGVSDNTSALGFLRDYTQQDRRGKRFPVTAERREDNRFIFPAQGGTLPIGALPYEPRGSAGIGNTDSSLGYRNSFRARPS